MATSKGQTISADFCGVRQLDLVGERREQ